MKRLIFIMLMAALPTQAATLAYFENQAGGRVVLTDEECKRDGKVYKGLLRAYMYTATGENDEGCYYIEDKSVATVWQSGQERRYPTSNFTVDKSQREPLPAQPRKQKSPGV